MSGKTYYCTKCARKRKSVSTNVCFTCGSIMHRLGVDEKRYDKAHEEMKLLDEMYELDESDIRNK